MPRPRGPRVEFVSLWSTDDNHDDDDDDDSSTANSVASSKTKDHASHFDKKPKSVKSDIFAKKTSVAPSNAAEGKAMKNSKRVSYFDLAESKEYRPTFKKQRADAGSVATTGNSKIERRDDSSNASEETVSDDYLSDDEYELREAEMRRVEYERGRAARREHSSKKMFYSRITTLRLRASPKRSPLLARKLRF